MKTYAEFLAEHPIPHMGVVFGKMKAPPGFEPRGPHVRKHKLEAPLEGQTYKARGPNLAKAADLKARYTEALSKTEWRGKVEIPDFLGLSVVAVGSVMCGAMADLCDRELEPCKGGQRWVWRLK